MNHPQQILTLTLLALGLFTLGAAGVAFADDDDDRRGKWTQSRADFPPVTNAAYREECGSCHMAYAPGLLPSRAWRAIMSADGLMNHYGDDASLTDELRTEIGAYLTANAADRSGGKRAKKFAEFRAGPGPGLPRISENPYFVKKHDEIPARLVTGNPEVVSFSQCNNCHRKAAEGDYSERQINIPGHGSLGGLSCIAGDEAEPSPDGVLLQSIQQGVTADTEQVCRLRAISAGARQGLVDEINLELVHDNALLRETQALL